VLRAAHRVASSARTAGQTRLENNTGKYNPIITIIAAKTITGTNMPNRASLIPASRSGVLPKNTRLCITMK